MALLNNLEIISLEEAKEFVRRWHYSNLMPPHCMTILGARDEKGLAAVASWGWGTRPKHTIAKMFPSLTTDDYWELNRLCLRDELPKNSESSFIAQCANWIKKNQPTKKLLFSWADGIRGKPGYIYQASSWLYGGFINTEIYLTKEGESVHPRFLNTKYGSRGKEVWMPLGLRKVFGKQFRYVRFLCSNREQKRLLEESPFDWSRVYPKDGDCEWKILTPDGQILKTNQKPGFTKVEVFRADKAPGLFDSTQDVGGTIKTVEGK
jgi:hypothetical protein